MLAIRDMAMKDRRWEMKALQRLLSLKVLLSASIDYLIFDTSPGIQHSSVNAVVSSDYVVVVTTMDALDIQGTRLMIDDLYRAFEKKTGILFNKVPIPLGLPLSEADKGKLAKQLQEAFNLPIVEMIPCYCDVLHTSRTAIFAFEKPDHPFTKDVNRAVNHLEQLIS
jgi:MinD-like ATPase involved in chromosome partitioning or flagellar assembly